MIANELQREIDAALVTVPEVQRLAETEALTFICAVAKRWVVDPSQTWWWTSLRDKTEEAPYDTDGFEHITARLPLEARAYLVITDDEHPPWPVLSGRVVDLVRLLGELRTCELFVVDPDLAWIVFDTHHDQVVVGGALPKSGRL